MKTSPFTVALTVLLLPAPAGQSASVVELSSSSFTVSEGADHVPILVLRRGDVKAVVSVEFATAVLESGPVALPGSDYLDVTTTLTFAAGETEHTILVPILNDALRETPERFRVTLANPTGDASLGTYSAIVTIADNDLGLAFEFSDYWAREDEGSVTVGVVRGDDREGPFTVEVRSADLSTTEGKDYAVVAETLSFQAGERLKLLTVPILNDGLREAAEQFRLTLSNLVGDNHLRLGASATVTIVDNDPGVHFAPAAQAVRQQDGSVEVVVRRGNDVLLGPFSVDYATQDGSARAGTDYVETHGTLEFGAGEMQRSVVVPFLDDGVAKADRLFRVRLSKPTGGHGGGPRIGRGLELVTICDMREWVPHALGMPELSADGQVSLALGGGYTPEVGVVDRFSQCYDLYPVEGSSDLMHWEPLGWLVRTNTATAALRLADGDQRAQRFYRTAQRTFVAPQLPPTGPYPVGMIRRALSDPSRRNRSRESAHCRFMVTVWYPAERSIGALPAPWVEPVVARDPDAWAGADARLPHIFGYSMLEAGFARGLGPCPVIFWSHGWTDYHEDGMDLAEDWASHGYVVVGIGHHDEYVTLFPDGTYRLLPDPNDVLGREMNELGLQDRVQDLRFVWRVLAEWNEQSSLLRGHLDTQNVAAAGFSWGGATAGEYCRTEPRCRAAISVDGGGWWGAGLSSYGLQKPSLAINNPTFDNDLLIAKASKEAVAFKVSDTLHETFWHGYWWFPTNARDLQRDHETRRIVRAFSLWFLNRHLKGSPDPMPDPKTYPRITAFQQR
ncbi:MAG: hypothetical protein M5U12_24935 [Verrucomicrobia bacterium]|nr:hypothetical protein [Verrucomicrobiota bacterium]